MLFLSAALVWAGEPAPETSDSIPPQASRVVARAPVEALNIKIDAPLVLIPVTVTDRLNRIVTGLLKERFRLFDENKEQQILSFSAEDAPVSIGLVFDCSGSMENKLDKSRAAVAQFLKMANPDDEFSLVEFDNRARLVQSFTRYPQDIQDHLAVAEANGATALLDAVFLAMRQMRSAGNPRKALLIVSDGGDNHSRRTENEIKSLVKESDVEIFAIGIYAPRDPGFPTPEERAGPALLTGLATQTGGREYQVKKLDDLPEIAARIGEALRYQYVLGYVPPNLPHSGKYRRVEVKLLGVQGAKSLRTFWRRGYYAPTQ